MSLVCHRHKFIYLKTRKTASTSIQAGLSLICEEDDHVGFMTSMPMDYIPRGGTIKATRGQSHNYPEDIRKIYPEEWNKYRKVVCVRNPFFAAVSLAYHSGVYEVEKIRDWILENLEWNDMEKFVYYEGRLITERVIVFEDLIDSYEEVCLDLGFNPSPLPHLRKNTIQPLTKPHVRQVMDITTYRYIKGTHERILKRYYPELSFETLWTS